MEPAATYPQSFQQISRLLEVEKILLNELHIRPGFWIPRGSTLGIEIASDIRNREIVRIDPELGQTPARLENEHTP
jgi:hypothetical protein